MQFLLAECFLADTDLCLGPIVFRGNLCQILWASLQNYVAHHGKIFQIWQPSICEQTELYPVKKIWLLNANCAQLGYASNIQRKLSVFLLKVQSVKLRRVYLGLCSIVMTISMVECTILGSLVWFFLVVCLFNYAFKQTILLVIGHFSNFAKFRGNIKIPWKRQIPWLGSKFCGLWKTVVPTYVAACNIFRMHIA